MATSQEARTLYEPRFNRKSDTLVMIVKVSFRAAALLFYLSQHTARFVLSLVFSKLGWRRRSSQTLIGESLADLCDSMGATFIKIGQILSTRCDLLPLGIMTPLSRLQDRIKPFSFRYVPVLIKDQFGHSLTDIFCEFEQEPLSSASVGSVYRARLRTGQLVAVKIRRPNIVQQVSCDLFLLRTAARFLARLPALRLIPLVEMVNKLGQCIEQQLDLRLEAENTKRFREQLKPYPLIHLPEPVDEYCTEAVLVMEFIDDLVRLDQLYWTQAEYQESLLTALKALYHMIFLEGFIHCDLHPGNLFLLPGGRVIILDAGFVARLDRESRHQFVEFFLGISMNAGRRCARILYETASHKPATFDRENFQQEVIELIHRSSGSNAAAFQVSSFAYQIFAIQKRFGLRGSTNFTMAILSLLVFEGIAKQLYPHLDFQAEAKPFLFKAMVRKRDETAARSEG